MEIAAIYITNKMHVPILGMDKLYPTNCWASFAFPCRSETLVGFKQAHIILISTALTWLLAP